MAFVHPESFYDLLLDPTLSSDSIQWWWYAKVQEIQTPRGQRHTVFLKLKVFPNETE